MCRVRIIGKIIGFGIYIKRDGYLKGFSKIEEREGSSF